MKSTRREIETRRTELLNFLKKNGGSYLDELSRQFDVSAITIRRDIQALESTSRIRIESGEVMLVDDPLNSEKDGIYNPEIGGVFSRDLYDKQKMNQESKKLICRKVASFIADDETVFLNSSTTLLYLFQYLNRKNVHVFTNNVAMALIHRPYPIRLTLLGGENNDGTFSMTGNITQNTLSSIISTTTVLGVSGICSSRGLTTSLYEEMEINQLMLNNCKGKRIIAAGPEKIGQSHCFITGNLQDIDILVTMSSADPEELKLISASGVEIVFADQVR